MAGSLTEVRPRTGSGGRVNAECLEGRDEYSTDPHVSVRAARRSPTITAFLGNSGCWTSMGGQAHPLGKPVPELLPGASNVVTVG
jgi:hypothetical protein